MLLDRLYKAVARVVLVSYTTTNLLAPLAHACEVLTQPPPIDHFAKHRLASLSDPLLKSKVISSPTPKIPSVNPLKASFQAQTYQYHLGVKTLSSQKTRFELNLSRKEKTSNGPFEQLHTATIHNGELTSSSSIEDDALLNLFRGASVHHFTKEADTICFAWSVSDFGTLKIARDGSVFFDQGSAPILLTYDLVMKTSNDLFLQNLGVSELTLESPTHIMGTVATNRLHMHHDVVNEGGLRAKEISGQGKLTNHAVLKLEGTSDQPAILSVPQLINKKGNSVSKEATIEAPYLHITSGNQFISNGEGAEFRVANSLLVDSAERGSFMNKGSLHLGDVVLNRKATNAGFWQAHQMTVNEKHFTNKGFGTLNILDALTVTSELMNEGDITAKNLLKLEKGVNKGTIKGDNLVVDIAESMTNVGEVHIRELSGTGTFTNKSKVQFTGSPEAPSKISVKGFENGTSAKTKASVKGNHIGVMPTNETFITHDNSEIVAKNLVFERPITPSSTPFQIKGSVHADVLDIYRQETVNSGAVSATEFSVHGNKFLNAAKATLDVNKSTKADTASFQNDGKMVTEGSFVQKTGEFINTGLWEHTGDIILGETNLKNEKTGTLDWQGGKWDFKLRRYDNYGTWVFDRIDCSQQFTIHNHGVLHLKNGAITFQHIINHKNLIFSAGQYILTGGLQNNGEMLTEGKLTQKTGTLSNRGTWNHTGDIDLGATTLKNEKTGTLNWQKGIWNFSPTNTYVNHGNWSLDNITCGRSLSITNHGDLHLKNGTLTFEDLINHNLIIFYNGAYFFSKSLINKNIMRFLNHDWKLGDIGKNYSHIKMELGEIECEKGWVHNVQVLPKAIRAQGDVTFSKNHQQGRSLEDLLKVSANGKVTFYTPTTTANRNYEFSNIAHLVLYVDGLFKTVHEFKAPALTLGVNGPVVCGESNGKMGIIAATQDYALLPMSEFPQSGELSYGKVYIENIGKKLKYKVKAPDGKGVEGILDISIEEDLTPTALSLFKAQILNETLTRGHTKLPEGPLTITAHSIDGRFAQIYGAGRTVIKSTNGDILVGAAAQGIGSDIRVASYPINIPNGAYIGSGNSLEVESPTSILVDYGHLLSGSAQRLKAGSLIRNTAGKISSLSTIQLETPQYMHTRGGTISCAMDGSGYGWAYSGFSRHCPISGPAILEGLGNIILNVTQVTNVASNIMSGKTILIGNEVLANGKEIKKLSQYIEQTYSMGVYACHDRGGWGHHWGYQWSSPCTLQSGEAIQINTGSVIVSGAWNSPIIMVDVAGNAIFHNGSHTRAYIDLSKPLFSNMTKAIEKEATRGGLLRITAHNEVQTAFPFGRSYIEEMKEARRVMLVTPGNRHLYQIPLNSTRIFNPLGSLSGDFLNLHIQSQLSELAGKVGVSGANGNNLKALMANADQFVEETGKSIVTQEDIQKASLARSMLLYGLEQVGNMIHQQMILCVTPQDINDVAGLSGDDIRIHAGGDLSFQNYEVVAEGDIDLFAKGKLSILTVLRRAFFENGYEDVVDGPTAKVISKKGNVKAIGKNGFQMRGATLRGLYRVLAGSTEGNTSIENVLLEKAVIKKGKEDGGLFGDDKVTTTTEITTTSQPSFIESVKAVVEVLCGNKEKTTITGSHIKALQAIKFTGGKVETNASVGVNKFTQHTQQDGMFSSKESISLQEYATLYPTLLEALEIYGSTDQATYRGTDFIADVFYDNTKEGASFGPTVATLKYFQQMVATSPLAKSDVGCEGWSEVMQPCRLAVNKIVRKIDEGEIKLESVDWDKNRTEIIGKFAETVYELKRHHTEWAIHEQVIPNEALIVVALAITIATQGAGGKMFAAAVSNMTGGTMVATGMGTAMASGGFTAICASAATNFLATGDPMATAKSLLSNKGLRSLAISVASAGLCHGIGGALDINTNPSLAALADPSKQVVFTDFLKANALKTIIETPLQSLIGGVPVEEAVKDGLKSLGVNTVSAYFAHHIGKIYGDPEKGMSYLEHKGLHGLLGGAAGWLINPTQKGLISGAIGGIVSEVVMDERREIARDKAIDIIAQAEKEGVALDGPTFQQRLYDGLSGELGFAKLSGATVSALFGQHASVAAQTATNAVENNAIALAVGIGLAAFEVYEIISVARDKGAKAALEKVAVDGTIAIATAGAGKVIYEVSKLSAPMAEIVWATYIAENPAFAQVASRVFAPIGKGITRAKALYHQADEALASGTSRLYNKMFGKKATSRTVDGLDLAETKITPKSFHEDWNLGPVLRGEKIEQSLGQNLPKNFPTIDKFSFHDGVATSIKSMDLRSKTYKNTAVLNNKLKQYVDVLSGFDGKYWDGVKIDSSQIQSRILELAIPHAGTSAQKSTIDQIINYGLTKGVTVNPIIH